MQWARREVAVVALPVGEGGGGNGSDGGVAMAGHVWEEDIWDLGMPVWPWQVNERPSAPSYS